MSSRRRVRLGTAGVRVEWLFVTRAVTSWALGLSLAACGVSAPDPAARRSADQPTPGTFGEGATVQVGPVLVGPDDPGQGGSPPGRRTIEFRVEVADDPEEQRRGLSDAAALPAGTGMLFVYPESALPRVTMAGMSFPIDVAWIQSDRVLGVLTLEPCGSEDRRSCPTTSPPTRVDAFLEVPAGALHGVGAGTPVKVRIDAHGTFGSLSPTAVPAGTDNPDGAPLP